MLRQESPDRVLTSQYHSYVEKSFREYQKQERFNNNNGLEISSISKKARADHAKMTAKVITNKARLIFQIGFKKLILNNKNCYLYQHFPVNIISDLNP